MIKIEIKHNEPYSGKPSKLVKKAKRRARQLKKLAKDADYEAISEIYKMCRFLNKRANAHVFDVDHIIPFFAGGLHHQDNLQILHVLDHRKKQIKDTEKYGIVFA